MRISGGKVVLRDWEERDLPVFRTAFDPKAEWLKWDAPYLAAPTGQEIEGLLLKKKALIAVGPVETRAELVIADPVSGMLLGRVSRYWQSEETHWLSVGIAIYSDSTWGAGLGREALGLWCDYLFANLPSVVRLDLRTWEGNERMARLAKSLGFREEARFRKARIVNGAHCDALGFGVLRDEWFGMFPAGFRNRHNSADAAAMTHPLSAMAPEGRNAAGDAEK